MSGTIGHLMYAILGAKAAAERRLPWAPILQRHFASYLAGAYLGCDVQTMPEAICVDTGQEVGYATVPLDASPVTGGRARPYRFRFQDAEHSPYELRDLFYGRAHLLFGWAEQDRGLTEPWDHLADYCTAVVEDAVEMFGPGERPLAYVGGWMSHVVGDSLIKSIRPGLGLQLLDGQYTAKNRPIQDLFTFHEVGVKELQLNWRALLADAADTPVEAVQLHYMRVGELRGRLGDRFPQGWAPERQNLLRAVLAENRRYFRPWSQYELKLLELEQTADGWQCSESLSRQSGGLSYAEMVAAAERADFRHALWKIGEATADLFATVAAQSPTLRRLPATDGPSWSELSARWRACNSTPAKQQLP